MNKFYRIHLADGQVEAGLCCAENFKFDLHGMPTVLLAQPHRSEKTGILDVTYIPWSQTNWVRKT